MPWVNNWVPAEVFLAHNGVTIYHTYKDDEQDQGQRSYWYGWAEDCSDNEPETTFDVRELPGYDRLHDFRTDYDKQVITAAIDSGYLTPEGPADRQKTEQLIVVKEPGKAPETRKVKEITLPVMRELVGGSIELQILSTSAGELDLWLNEEGKLEDQTPNLAIVHDRKIVDIIVGTVFVCGRDGEGSVGLTQEQAAAAIDKLHQITLSPAQF